ncbi:hypothetical protein ULF88_17865 [Halopseudomonas pachastrellae]|nr:hypothetical protein [Halopseudomonas pachastrellae]
MHPEVVAVTERLRERSRVSRAAYLAQMAQAPAGRRGLSCGNLAHGMAACSAQDKARIRMIDEVNIGMVSATTTCCRPTNPTSVTRNCCA